MLGLSPWSSLAAVAVAAILGWLLGGRAVSASTAPRLAHLALDHGWTPIAVGALTSAVVLFAWGGLARTPVIHDEAAYLLQAELFARGLWAGPAPVLPEFFEQLYVLVIPSVASKYPPGHSLMLAPGAFVGLPGLPVVLLNGVTGALIFALARRVGGGPVGLLTWVVWVTCFPAIYFRASYLSEVTSGTAWLVALWCLLRWRDGHRRVWLLGVASAVGVVAVTRPLTAVALSLPIAVVVLRDVSGRQRWRDFGLAVGIGTACLALIPVWSVRTTGSPVLTPLELYTRVYVPFDGPGFGVDDTVRPVRSVPPDMALTNESFREEHRRHTVSALPITLVNRLRMIARDMWYDWRLGLAPFALVALFALPPAAWFALASLAAHVGLYLLYAHPAFWTVYYLESEPVLALVTALGVAWAVARAADIGQRAAGGGDSGRGRSGAVLVPVLMLAAAACVPGAMTLRLMRDQVNRDRAYFERFDALVRGVRDERAMVFVRYGPAHNDNLSLVRNPASYDEARVWIVHDRGVDNARLIAAARSRRPYLFDEPSWTLRPLDSPLIPPATAGP
jgi:4-amino-4-deoxy-L-arabinose transferase-like glycosyltransferase